MALRPNQRFILQKRAGNDVYGQTVPGLKSPQLGSVVKFPTEDVKSSVRTDSSASRGNAHEFETHAVVCLPATTTAELHDILIIRGLTLRITKMHPRWDAAGRFDHYECDLTIWTQE